MICISSGGRPAARAYLDARGGAAGGAAGGATGSRKTGGGKGKQPPKGGAGTARRQAVERDLMTAICEAVDELFAAGPGDILVFLSGEREIRDAEDALRGHLGDRVDGRGTPTSVEVVPLYARLSAAEQHRVFEPHAGRRVVLATNVAETSLTVPGIRYVVDPGTARISRFSKATKVQRLPIEPISQASANQRSGRCGRVADGIAIRLYSEDDFESRPEFTDPEILRTSLASVILQMVAAGVAAGPDDVAKFPFVDQPDVRSIRDGVGLLTELGAHLAKRVYSEPHWSSKQGAAQAYEKVLLYGLPIVAQRKVLYGKVDPAGARVPDPSRDHFCGKPERGGDLADRLWAGRPVAGDEAGDRRGVDVCDLAETVPGSDTFAPGVNCSHGDHGARPMFLRFDRAHGADSPSV